MAKYKHASPISHHFNRDPEIIELRQKLGDWLALAWQELLHEGDRNDGLVMGSLEQIAFRLAPVSLQLYQNRAAKRAMLMLRFALDKSWITLKRVGDNLGTTLERLGDNSRTTQGYNAIFIVKHWEYHRMRVPNSANIRSTPNLSESEPNSDNKRNTLCAEPEFPADYAWIPLLIKNQNGGFPVERFLDYEWWNQVSYTCGGLNEPFLKTELARIQVWLMNNPGRRPTPKGFRRFVSTWLQNAHEKERRFKNAGTR